MWIPAVQLTLDEQIAEFDQWVTPNLGTVRDTEKFQVELNSLGSVLARFASESEDSPVEATLRQMLENSVSSSDRSQVEAELQAVISALYLVTAKSDNAVKCQFPIWFRARYGQRYPRVRRNSIEHVEVPSVLKSIDVVRRGLDLARVSHPDAVALLADYTTFLLADEHDVAQLTSLVSSVRHLERERAGSSSELLAPLVSFQVRGSVAASGGHDPEQIVREYLVEWGLQAEVHFNSADVTAASVVNWLVAQGDDDGGQRSEIAVTTAKTRAFDFVIPHRLADTGARLFVQSQFYAGDSGSVSHKNVDQALAARGSARLLFPNARFVELVDGAGYCGSLRRDLQHLLGASTTHDFIQVRSIPVRLRRLLQEIGVVSPLDIALRVAAGVNGIIALEKDIVDSLGHKIDVRSIVTHLRTEAWLVGPDEALSVSPARHTIVERYLYLDGLIASGQRLSSKDRILAPGFGANFGVEASPSWITPSLEHWLRRGVLQRTESQ